jgi:valyl-tRNA synthetase
MSDIKEARLFSSFMMSNILKMLHPFIPFFTEHVWLKNNYKKMLKTNLISAEWPNFNKIIKFDKSHNDINNLIELISSIRSTKAELKVTPKLFSDVYFIEKKSKLSLLAQKHINLFKQVGRVNKILEEKEVDKNTIEILTLNEKISIKFNEDIDLASQKESILQKLANLEKKINGLQNKLNNRAYLKNAPKSIVQNDKRLLKQLTIEEDKLRSIVSSIN